MTEKTKEEELKQKLLDYFDKKLTDLTTKMQTDIDTIETMKFDYYDSVIKKFQEIEEEHKKEEEEEKEKQEKEKHDKEKHDKEKHEKKDATKAEKPAKKADTSARPKTAAPATKKTGKAKEEKSHDTGDTHKDKEKKDTKTKAGGGKATSTIGGKTPLSKKDGGKKSITGKADPRAKTATKKGNPNAKKGDAKKGKKDTKKDKKEEKKEEPVVEEKKPVVINPKYIYTVSDDIKNNPSLCCLYFIIKGKYIVDKKQILHISTNSPLLYKSLGSNMKYLLDDKKNEVQNKANEIEKFLNNYGDLNNYLTKELTINKKAINMIQFLKKKEEEEILKMAEIPKEVGVVVKCIYYIIDEPFDEGMNTKELFENMINNILPRNEDKTFKSLLMNYFNHNKYLNLTKEKYDKINNIINENNTVLNMSTMTKLNRPISLFCLMLKEVYDYINLKTLDGQFYFDLRAKNDELQKYKDILYLIEHDGKRREPPKEDKKEEPPKEDKKEEPPKEEQPQTNEQPPTTEEPPKTEVTAEQPKADEGVKPEEQPKIEEPPKTEETTEQQVIQETPTEQPKTEEVPPNSQGGEGQA